jgi:hypothetical protein
LCRGLRRRRGRGRGGRSEVGRMVVGFCVELSVGVAWMGFPFDPFDPFDR